MRQGAAMDLRYQWFEHSKPVGKQVIVQLQDSDCYIMSDLAVGWNWRKSSQLTLRHSAGAPRFTALPKPKPPKTSKKISEKRKAEAEDERPKKKRRTDSGGGGGGGDAAPDAGEDAMSDE
jgi:hypothetical protein